MLRNDKRRLRSALFENLHVSVADVFIALISLMQGKTLHTKQKAGSSPPALRWSRLRHIVFHSRSKLHHSKLSRSYRAMKNKARSGIPRLPARYPAATCLLIDPIGINVENISRRGPDFWKGRCRKARPLRAVFLAPLAMYVRLDWSSANKSYVSGAYVPRKDVTYLFPPT